MNMVLAKTLGKMYYYSGSLYLVIKTQCTKTFSNPTMKSVEFIALVMLCWKCIIRFLFEYKEKRFYNKIISSSFNFFRVNTKA